MYLYLSNDNAALGGSAVEVFFDDFTVQHIKSPVVQQDDYYAFGLEFNSYQRENATKNNYLYNGKERQDELDLGWLDYGARMYMPEIGRWGAIDYMSEKYNSHSPYNYVMNNPMTAIDPDGNDVYLIFWFTSDKKFGHVGIAVDNYKKVKEKDKDGNEVEREVADGTVTYYDFYAEGGVTNDNYDEDLTGLIYKKNFNVEDLGRIDFETGQDRPANGVVRISAAPNMTKHIAHEKEKLYRQQQAGNPIIYNGEKFNCADFAKGSLNEVPGFYQLSGVENISYGAYSNDITTPNFLYRGARKIVQAGTAKGSVLKETGNPDQDWLTAVFGKIDSTPNR